MRASNKFQRWLLIGTEATIKQYFAIKQDSLIEQREEEIHYPWKPDDENVGGGKTSNKGASKQEITFEKIESDPLLKQYREVVDRVEKPLNELNNQEKMVIMTMYDCKKADTGRYSDKQVADILNAPVKLVADVRKMFIRRVANT